MAKTDRLFNLRIPEDIKLRLERAAVENRRSVTAEILSRLQITLEVPLRLVHKTSQKIDYSRLEKPRAIKNSAVAELAHPEYQEQPLTDIEWALLTVFRKLPPEKQLALLSLFK